MNDFFFNVQVIIKFWQILLKKNFLLNKDVFKFERKISTYFGLRYALGVANCTDALTLSLKAIDIKCGDEVIVPAISFFSSAGSVAWIGATPVFVDISLPTLHINEALIESAITSKTKAIIVSHLNGVVVDIKKIIMIAKKYKLYVIEDYAQAFGAFSLERLAGDYGDIVCLSLNSKKIFHGYGDGGALLTNNREIYEKVRLMRMYGTTVDSLGINHDIIGGASRLGVWNAAVLNLQFNTISQTISKRRNNYFLYLKLLNTLGDHLILPAFALNKHLYINGYRFVVLAKKRDSLVTFLKKHNIDVNINYGQALPLMEAFSYLGYSKGDFPIAEKIARESFTLPTDGYLDSAKIHKIVNLIKTFYLESDKI